MKACYAIQRVRAIADLVQLEPKIWLLTRVNVPKERRGQGYGSFLLDSILKDADAEQSAIVLEASPSDGLTLAQLQTWYERRGFVREGATNVMRREPRSSGKA